MSVDSGLIEWVAEATEPLGRFAMRKMFGGAGLYLNGVIFAIVSDDELWLKADAENEAAFEAAGCERFSYRFADGREGSMNYRRAPADVYDDPEALLHWAAIAFAAGQRGQKRKR